MRSITKGQIVFPAYAGVIPYHAEYNQGANRVPRIRGGDPLLRPFDGHPRQVFPAYAGVIPGIFEAEMT